MSSASPDPASSAGYRALIEHARRQAQAAADHDTITRDSAIRRPDHGTELLPASAISGYELLREIHRGGQGVVYLAIQKSTSRKVAVKVMREGPFGSPRERARFEREVRILGQLKHPNIVAIHDSGMAAGCHYFAMDYISGLPLHEYVDARRKAASDAAALPQSRRTTARTRAHSFHDEVIGLFAKICDAVNAAHERGIIHRDLKPGNICVDSAGEPHILDFGLARTMTAGSDDSHLQIVTATGQFMGSVPWASPEQAEAAPSKIDRRTDVYSLGVILYQMLTDEFPYMVLEKTAQVLHSIQHVEPRRPTSFDATIDADVETIILKCLSKEQQRRYECAGDISHDIRRYLAGEPIEARRDSAMYVARKRVGSAARRHPVVARIGCGLLGIAVAQWIARPAIFDWTRANAAFEGFVTSPAVSPPPTSPLAKVRVIGIPEPDRLVAIGRSQGIAVDPRIASSARALHGRLMERLARSGARVVAWDVVFRTRSDLDGDFMRGVGALQRRGIDVVVATPTWRLADDGLPEVNPVLRPGVRWGAAMAHFQEAAPWRLELARQRGQTDPLPSLALRAVMCFRYPGVLADIRIDEQANAIDLLYYKAAAPLTGMKSYLDESDRLVRASFMRQSSDDEINGVRNGDLLALHTLSLPAEESLRASTIKYGDVFNATEKRLRQWFEGRAIVIGRLENPQDTFDRPDGRKMAGCFGHAQGMEELLDQLAMRPRRPAGGLPSSAIVVAAALCGLAVAALRPAALERRAIMAAILVVAAGLSVGLARMFHVIYNPLIALVAMAVACEVSAVLPRGAGRPLNASTDITA